MSVAAENEALQTALAQTQALLARATERADEAHAEISAATKRIENASAKELQRRTRALLESFLLVADDLDRAIESAKAHAKPSEVAKGLELVRRSLLTQLGRFGVTRAPALGELFNPMRHEALAMVPVGHPDQAGRVLDVMREGYLIDGETLRPAGVAVGRR